MVLRAFFDESGTDPKENKALILGGFIGKVEEWERASDAWDECLRQNPSIKYFSHNEAQSLDGQFSRFRRETADAKVLTLAKIIARFAIRGIAASVSHSWFVHRDSKAAKGMIGSRAYDWGFNTVTSGVLRYVDECAPGDEKVDFVFDERSELDGCIQMFNQMKANPFFASSAMRRAGQCSAGDDEEIAALQMADLLAWEFSKVIETKIRGDAFNLIVSGNHIVHLPCQPPRNLPDVLKIQKLGNAIKQKAINVLVRMKKSSPSAVNGGDRGEQTAQELVLEQEYFRQLVLEQEYFRLQWNRLITQFHDDEDFQKFLARYVPVKQMNQDKEFERFDSTMRKLIKVPHSDIKEALDAEKKAKDQKKKRKAKKPSASDRASSDKD